MQVTQFGDFLRPLVAASPHDLYLDDVQMMRDFVGKQHDPKNRQMAVLVRLAILGK